MGQDHLLHSSKLCCHIVIVWVTVKTYLIMQLLEEFNLIHQRLNLPFQVKTRQSGIIHILAME